MHSSEGNAYLE